MLSSFFLILVLTSVQVVSWNSISCLDRNTTLSSSLYCLLTLIQLICHSMICDQQNLRNVLIGDYTAMVVESPNQLNLRSEIQPDESPISVWFLQCVILLPWVRMCDITSHHCPSLPRPIDVRYGMTILSEDV